MLSRGRKASLRVAVGARLGRAQGLAHGAQHQGCGPAQWAVVGSAVSMFLSAAPSSAPSAAPCPGDRAIRQAWGTSGPAHAPAPLSGLLSKAFQKSGLCGDSALTSHRTATSPPEQCVLCCLPSDPPLMSPSGVFTKSLS